MLPESKIEPHDIAITIPARGPHLKARTLRIVLLSPSNLLPPNEAGVDDRLVRFVRSSGGIDSVIVFLLNEFVTSHTGDAEGDSDSTGTRAYAQLQVEILCSPDLRGMPILPLHSTRSLVKTLRNHVSMLTSRTPLPPPPMRAVELLQYCTASAPLQLLGEHSVNIISDVVPDMKTLALLGTGDEGLREDVMKGVEGEISAEELGSL